MNWKNGRIGVEEVLVFMQKGLERKFSLEVSMIIDSLCKVVTTENDPLVYMPVRPIVNNKNNYLTVMNPKEKIHYPLYLDYFTGVEDGMYVFKIMPFKVIEMYFDMYSKIKDKDIVYSDNVKGRILKIPLTLDYHRFFSDIEDGLILYQIFMFFYLVEVEGISPLFRGDRPKMLVDGISLDSPYASILYKEEIMRYVPSLVSLLVNNNFSDSIDFQRRKEIKKEKENLERVNIVSFPVNQDEKNKYEIRFHGEEFFFDYCRKCAMNNLVKVKNIVQSKYCEFKREFIVYAKGYLLSVCGKNLTLCFHYWNIAYHHFFKEGDNILFECDLHIRSNIILSESKDSEGICDKILPDFKKKICFYDPGDIIHYELLNKWGVSPICAKKLIIGLFVFREEMPLFLMETCSFLSSTNKRIYLKGSGLDVAKYLGVLESNGLLRVYFDKGKKIFEYFPNLTIISLSEDSVYVNHDLDLKMKNFLIEMAEFQLLFDSKKGEFSESSGFHDCNCEYCFKRFIT